MKSPREYTNNDIRSWIISAADFSRTRSPTAIGTECHRNSPMGDASATGGEAGAKYLWAASVPLFVAISVASWGVVRRDLIVHAFHNPFCWLGVLIVVVSIIALVS